MNKLLFIRHAETDFNKQNLWMGCTDHPLNQTGMLQAQYTALELSSTRLDAIYSSPLSRAVTSAETIQKHNLSNPPIFILDGLKERNFGKFEGRKKSEKNRELLELSDSVETVDNVKKRVKEALAQIPRHGNYLIVSHSAIYRIIRSELGFQSAPDVHSLLNMQCVEIVAVK
ncbi:histidine phosphatase family protein [Hydrogenovibrio sp. JE_KL2]|uniref:histidine phosphatase family protein n=1 Tax=Hydrogenovibrio sp. JE_KL2 TaxID=2651188 RepID=UPI001562AAC7|nr:histidine phosphatase family protein [Hydrogenovibrio sp. JE_KL2]